MYLDSLLMAGNRYRKSFESLLLLVPQQICLYFGSDTIYIFMSAPE